MKSSVRSAIDRYLPLQVGALLAAGILFAGIATHTYALFAIPLLLAVGAAAVFYPRSILYLYFASFFWGRYLFKTMYLSLVVNDAALLLLLLAYGARYLAAPSERGDFKINYRTMVPLLGLFFWSLVSFVSNIASYDTRFFVNSAGYLLRFAELVGIAILFADRRLAVDVDKIISLCLVLFTLQFPVALYQTYFTAAGLYDEARMQVFGTFSPHHATLGTLGLFALAFCLYRFLAAATLRVRLFYAGIAAINLFTIILSGSRSALIGIAFGAVVFVAMRFKFRITYLLYLAIFVVVIALLAKFSPLKNVISMTFAGNMFNAGFDLSTVSRFMIWRGSLNQFFTAGPWIQLAGIGAGAFPTIKFPFVIWGGDASMCAAHNNFLHILVELGIVGLAGFVIYLFACLQEFFHRWRRDPLAFSFFLLTIALIASSLTQETFWFQRPLLVIWQMYVVFCAAIFLRTRGDLPEPPST
jgi:O-antigen ligase